MAIGWEVPRSRRFRTAPAAAVLVAVAVAVLAVLAILAVTDYRPLIPVRGDAGGYRAGRAPTGSQTAVSAATAAEASAEATTGRAEASSEHSVTVSGGGGDGGPAGVVVANSGSATADTGGDVVVGSDQPDGSSASISTGDATAVGNRSATGVGP
jgi:hypothetical protein